MIKDIFTILIIDFLSLYLQNSINPYKPINKKRLKTNMGIISITSNFVKDIITVVYCKMI